MSAIYQAVKDLNGDIVLENNKEGLGTQLLISFKKET